MQDIIPPSREEALAPLPTGPTRRRRSGLIVLGLATALGLGLAGGLYLNRFVDLDLAATWVRISSFSISFREIVSKPSGSRAVFST